MDLRAGFAERRGAASWRAAVTVAVAAAFSILIGASLIGGCGGGSKEPLGRPRYNSLLRQSFRLYGEIHPLRASRLGMTERDSLLFAFGAEEIARARVRLEKIKREFERLPTRDLTQREIDRARVLAAWASGELLALGEGGESRRNPVLYVWMAEEALWGTPLRLASPAPGELEAYRARISRVPALLESARHLLGKVPTLLVREAIARCDSISAGMGELGARAAARWGEAPAPDLSRAKDAILGFRDYLSSEIEMREPGSLLVGSENLSNVLLFDELIESDPNMIIAEAEKRIAQLRSQATSIRGLVDRGIVKPMEKSAPDSLDATLSRVLGALGKGPRGGGAAAAPDGGPGIVPARSIDRYAPVPKSPYLTVPIAERTPLVVLLSAPFAPPCDPSIALSRTADPADEAALRLALLDLEPRALEPRRAACEDADTAFALFGSAIFDEAWRHRAARVAVEKAAAKDPILSLRLAEAEIRSLALAVVVFRLHAGTMVSEAAVSYIREQTGVNEAAAQREVVRAAVSPAAAYPGIALILEEEILSKLGYVRGVRNPDEDFRKLLGEGRGLPLPILEERIPRARE